VSPDKQALAATAFALLEDRMRGYDGIGRHEIVAHSIIERATT